MAQYGGWFGQLYDPARYEYRGKIAKSGFVKNCLAEYAEVLASYYRCKWPVRRSIQSNPPAGEAHPSLSLALTSPTFKASQKDDEFHLGNPCGTGVSSPSFVLQAVSQLAESSDHCLFIYENNKSLIYWGRSEPAGDDIARFGGKLHDRE